MAFSPVLLAVSVSEGNDVWCSAAAVTDDNRDRGVFFQTLQNYGNHVGTTFQDQTHQWDTLAQTWDKQSICWRIFCPPPAHPSSRLRRLNISVTWLTCVDLLQSDVLLQLSAKADLGAVLPAGPVVREDKVGVATVQHCQFTEWIGHGLVGSGHLEQTKFCLVELSSSSVQSSFFFVLSHVHLVQSGPLCSR